MFDFLNPADASENPFLKFIMPTPAQQATQTPQVNPETQAIVEALRGGQQNPMGAPASAGRVQSAGYFGQGTDLGRIGNNIATGIKSMAPKNTPEPWEGPVTVSPDLSGNNW
jgi:hypothetical protein